VGVVCGGVVWGVGCFFWGGGGFGGGRDGLWGTTGGEKNKDRQKRENLKR